MGFIHCPTVLHAVHVTNLPIPYDFNGDAAHLLAHNGRHHQSKTKHYQDKAAPNTGLFYQESLPDYSTQHIGCVKKALQFSSLQSEIDHFRKGHWRGLHL